MKIPNNILERIADRDITAIQEFIHSFAPDADIKNCAIEESSEKLKAYPNVSDDSLHAHIFTAKSSQDYTALLESNIAEDYIDQHKENICLVEIVEKKQTIIAIALGLLLTRAYIIHEYLPELSQEALESLLEEKSSLALSEQFEANVELYFKEFLNFRDFPKLKDDSVLIHVQPKTDQDDRLTEDFFSQYQDGFVLARPIKENLVLIALGKNIARRRFPNIERFQD